MSFRTRYYDLAKKEYKFSLIEEVGNFKNECLKSDNKEFYFLSDILICDIYIEHEMLDEGLDVLDKEFNNIDKVVFSNVYLAFLDRYIYIYITKKNLFIAKKYLFLKEKLINKTDTENYNRWLLEMTYVCNENQYDEALNYFQQILDNNPTQDMKSYVLSNMTKIYIDKKLTKEAKETLNKCLTVRLDHQGKVYCNYLLAKICLLESKIEDAEVLFSEIMANEEINTMTLPMINEYLELLLKANKLDQALLIINKISLFINASNDLEIKKQFLKNKLDYLIATKDIENLQLSLAELYKIDDLIKKEETKVLQDSFYIDTNDIMRESRVATVNHVENTLNLISSAVIENSLRDILLDYGKKLNTSVNFSTMTFVLFNKVEELECQMNDNIQIYYYKNNKLYEKTLNYSAIEKTPIELLISKNIPLSFDFDKLDMKLIDIFTNKEYDTKYLTVLPFIYRDDLFGAMIYTADDEDITDSFNFVLLKMASKILENNLIVSFLYENHDILTNTLKAVSKEYSVGTTYINNEIMYLNENLKRQLKLRFSSISREDYRKKIHPKDLMKYDLAYNASGYEIEYRVMCGANYVLVREKMFPYTDSNKKFCFMYGTITVLEQEKVGYILGDKEFEKLIKEIKIRARSIEYKFSLIRLRGNLNEYKAIKDHFTTDPYYLSDGTYALVLENETNQKILDRYIKDYLDRVAVVRYPRDIINISEIVNISKLCLDKKAVYFNEEVYKNYIKGISISSLVNKMLSTNIILSAVNYEAYNHAIWCEIRSIVNGVDGTENARDYLEGDLLYQYEEKLFDEYRFKNVNCNCLMFISSIVLLKIIKENKLTNLKNLNFIIRDICNNELLEEIKESGLKIIVDCSLLKQIDTYNIIKEVVTGIYVSKFTPEALRNQAINVGKLFNLPIFSNEEMKDYDLNIYQTDIIERID